MENISDDMGDLIGRYLAKEATEEERVSLETWMLESSSNQKYFEQLKIIFETAAGIKIYPDFNTDAAWHSVKAKLNNDGEKAVYPLNTRFNFGTPWKIAAALLVIAIASYWVMRVTQKPIDTIAISTLETTKRDTLPDGSTIVLNKQSTLAYEYDARKNKRSVSLKGEAYFNVVHERRKPFLIKAGDVIIEDIGTTFNVKAYPNSASIAVYVESGEVAFYTRNNPGIHLVAGQTGFYHRQSKSFSWTAETDTNVLSYKTRLFNFHNETLGAIVETINAVYETKIKLADPALEACMLNVSFNGEPIEVIAEVIAETLSLKITRLNSEIILNGTGCGH